MEKSPRCSFRPQLNAGSAVEIKKTFICLYYRELNSSTASFWLVAFFLLFIDLYLHHLLKCGKKTRSLKINNTKIRGCSGGKKYMEKTRRGVSFLHTQFIHISVSTATARGTEEETDVLSPHLHMRIIILAIRTTVVMSRLILHTWSHLMSPDYSQNLSSKTLLDIY